MLKRIYVDNFRCMSNFELAPEPLSLILGRNGSGKSTLCEVLRILRDLVSGVYGVDEAFPAATLTRWDSRSIQRLEIDVSGPEGKYRYQLQIAHEAQRDVRRIQEESLLLEQNYLFAFGDGEVQLYRDNYSAGPRYSADWSRSALASVPARHDNQKLTWFKRWLEGVWIVAPQAPTMGSESRGEESRLAYDMSNFASWYRHMAQEDPGALGKLNEVLAAVIDGFVGLKLPSAGRDTRVLTVTIRSDSGEGGSSRHAADYDFDELSDGQRALIALYALLCLGLGGSDARHRTLCIDEPVNYISLAEIQPWLMRLGDLLETVPAQVLLISHHPEVINYLAAGRGKLLERTNAGPVRVRDFTPDVASGLSPAETIARGWE